MEIKLNSLIIENFKGIKNFQVEFDAISTVIKAENGIGKTTIYDAFLYLLFDKDSTGRKDFDSRPLDKNNNAIKGLVLSVTASLDLDGVCHIFKKENHERVVKNQIKGFETLCYVDEVPKKISEYSEYIESLIPEDTFKMLTNLRHFNEGLHWKERRTALLDIAGEIGTPEGFDELLAALNGRSIEDYKKVLAGQKDRLKKDQFEINPRIDELNKGFAGYAEANTPELTRQRTELQGKIKKVDDMRSDIFSQESERQKKITALNVLQSKKITREAELKTDTSGITNLLEEKQQIENSVAATRLNVSVAKNNLSNQTTVLNGKKSELTGLLDTRNAIFAEYTNADAVDPEAGISDESKVCYACGQKLTAKKLEENETKRQEAIAKAVALKQSNLDKISARGTAAKESIEKVKGAIEILEGDIKKANELLVKAQAELATAESNKTKRFAEIDIAIKSNPKPDPELDKVWQGIVAEITKAQAEIGEPVSDQLQALENRKNILNSELAEINTALSQADNAKKNRARITELEQQEKDLAQKIADVEKQLADISAYAMAESKLIEDSVNQKFKHVKFKLFDYLLNKEIELCCEATLNGVPYSDLSYGQKIFVGIDIINVLSAHYGMSVPLWIDNSEGLTLPVEFEGQTIQLFAQSGTSKLTVETSAIKQTTKSRKVA